MRLTRTYRRNLVVAALALLTAVTMALARIGTQPASAGYVWSGRGTEPAEKGKP
jgi:hypothetical protein